MQVGKGGVGVQEMNVQGLRAVVNRVNLDSL